MRRRYEAASCKRRGFFFGEGLAKFEQIPRLSKDMLAYYQKELRFTEKEIQFCYECAWLDALRQANEAAEESERKSKFRMAIKQRLVKDPGDLILPDKKAYPADFKEALQEAYLEELASMEYTLKALERIEE